MKLIGGFLLAAMTLGLVACAKNERYHEYLNAKAYYERSQRHQTKLKNLMFFTAHGHCWAINPIGSNGGPDNVVFTQVTDDLCPEE